MDDLTSEQAFVVRERESESLPAYLRRWILVIINAPDSGRPWSRGYANAYRDAFAVYYPEFEIMGAALLADGDPNEVHHRNGWGYAAYPNSVLSKPGHFIVVSARHVDLDKDYHQSMVIFKPPYMECGAEKILNYKKVENV